MHHDVAVIDDDPVAHWVAVDGGRGYRVVCLEAAFDFAGDGLEVRLGGAAANDEEIRERRDAAQIEGNNVLGLFVGSQFRAARGQMDAGQDERASR